MPISIASYLYVVLKENASGPPSIYVSITNLLNSNVSFLTASGQTI